MKYSKITAVISGILLLGYGEYNSKMIENTRTKTAAAPIEIIGKTGVFTFQQFQVEETFVSETKLHWKIKNTDGTFTQEDEDISFKRLNDNQFFINWIEKTGLTVSQVIDAKKGTVTSFVSRNDTTSDRGQRAANFLEGKFEIKK